MSAWRRKFSLIILWIPVNCPAIVIMLASDSMIAVLTTNTFVQVKVFSYLFFLDYLLMNTADHKLIKEEFSTTLPVKMFGPFWSVWCKMALAEVGVSLP